MYRCPFCVSTLIDSANFLRHAKLKHKAQIFIESHCPFSCSGKFNNIYSYKKHLVAKHILTSMIGKVCTKTVKQHHRSPIPVKTFNTSPSINQLNFSGNHFRSSNSNENTSHEATTSIDNLIEDFVENDLQAYENTVMRSAAYLVCKLYNKSTLPRAYIADIINMITEYLNSTCFDAMKKKCKSLVNSNNNTLFKMIEITQNSFEYFKSEHLTFSIFEKLNCLIRPVSIPVHAVLKPCRDENQTIARSTETTIQVVPIKKVFKKFLELPNVFNMIVSNIRNVKKSLSIISIMQGTTWKSIEKEFHNQFVLPLLLYHDDFEINNSLGSHKNIHKLGAVYCTIPGIPNEYAT
ncbi:uncharacterized protein [Venturia canescens]|uniref:uncharacterized protein n=1 Tax=Venturia canescens TaxID=32260 RepID=UPI001C9C7CEF|nr:uncharacterized protein LOC122408445 [Venturia canescens]